MSTINPPASQSNSQNTRTLSILVENKFGVLFRITGLFSARAYNIEPHGGAHLRSQPSRITMVVRCEPLLAQQIRRQVENCPTRWKRST